MNVDQIIKADITISTSTTIDGGYDKLLILGPLPKNPAGHQTPDVSSYTGTDELKEAGFTTGDPVYDAAQIAFSQSPRPREIFVAVRKSPSGDNEAITDTLERAKAVTGWYALCPAGIDDSEIEKISAWIESNSKICLFQTTSLTDNPVGETMSRSAVIHATNKEDYINVALAARFLSYDPGSEIWSYKTLSAVSGQDLSDRETKALEAANISFFTKVGRMYVVIGGKMANGEWIDTIRFCDWLITQIQSNCFNLLLQYSKVPYTKEGIALMESALRSALDSGVKAGGIASPEIIDEEQVPSYTIEVPSISEISEATRHERKLLGIKWCARLAGAIKSVEIAGTVNY